MGDAPIVPPMEPYKAAVIVSPDPRCDSPVPLGVRHFPYPLTQHPRDAKANIDKRHLIPCHGIVIREQSQQVLHSSPDYTGQVSRISKPCAAVVPTPADSSSRPRPEVSHMTTQTDDVGIDMDLLINLEDMLRTQRSLTLPKLLCDDDAMNNALSISSLPSDHSEETDDVRSLHLQIRDLKEALDVQLKTNTDLKRLLVSALAGNSTIADQLVDLTSDNARLSGRSEHLAAQKAVLAEVADTAGIAADVWRAKCLAGRVLAAEAAKRLALANRRVHLTRHALAHLLGERAQLRRQLGQVAALLCSSNTNADILLGTTPPLARDTLGLASVCHQLALKSQPERSESNWSVVCEADTPGERLAIIVLTSDAASDDPSRISFSGDLLDAESELSLTLPPVPRSNTDDLVEQALKSFESTKYLGLVTPCLSTCRGCKGNVTSV